MTPELYLRAGEVFRSLVDLPAEDRDTELARQTDGEPEVAAAVAALLAGDAEANYEAASSPISLSLRAAWQSVAIIDDFPSRTLGPYQVLRQIGRGGMGSVYLGLQSSPVERRVAIKVIGKEHCASDLSQRFASERQFLAGLTHPNIAVLIDAGDLADGRPYLVMEYIEGVHLDEYCDLHRLSVDERLTLFRSVCGAVEFAHQRAVIHRDLKPANILVDQEGRPKLIDFGIAKLAHPELGFRTNPPTRPGGLPFTPEYCSPEQLSGRAASTTSDVYSLGVVLHELLTGRLPMPGDCSGTIIEPSKVVVDGSQKHPIEAMAALRRQTPAKLARRLRGDLDAIVRKATDAREADRYHSVKELSDDLVRHANCEPISLHERMGLHRLSRWARRNKAVASLVVSIAAVLLVGMSIISWQWWQLAQQQNKQIQALWLNLQTAEPESVPAVIERLKDYPLNKVQAIASSGPIAGQFEERNASRWRLAEIALSGTVLSDLSERAARELREAVIRSSRLGPREILAFRSVLGTPTTLKMADLREILERDSLSDSSEWLGMAAQYAWLDPNRAQLELVGGTADRLVNQDLRDAAAWAKCFPVQNPSDGLYRTLMAIAAADSKPLQHRDFASRMIVEALGDTLCHWVPAMLDARPEQARNFRPLLKRHAANKSLNDLLTKQISLFSTMETTDRAAADLQAQRSANAAAALICLETESVESQSLVWDSLGWKPDPSLRSYLIDRAASFGGSPRALVARLDAPGLDGDELQGLLLALGSYDPATIPRGMRDKLEATVAALRKHAASGVSSAAGWLSVQWRLELENSVPITADEWSRNSLGTVMVRFDPMPGASEGSSPTKAFTICATEVTREHFQAFLKAHTDLKNAFERREAEYAARLKKNNADETLASDPDAAQGFVNWTEAAMFCNWLSDQEALDPCYSIGCGIVQARPNHLLRAGYRLPTSLEWEFACSAGAATPRFFGHTFSLLPKYAWCATNSPTTTLRTVAGLLPNRRGLFDLYGNVLEWCDDEVSGDVPNARMLRGGAIGDGPARLGSTIKDRGLAHVDQPAAVQGFRIARTAFPTATLDATRTRSAAK